MGQAVMTLGETDNARTVEVHLGDEVVLRLYENASTGYSWSFDDLDGKILTARDDGYGRQPEAVGGGGMRQWTLQTKAAGTTQIKLKLWRRWEGDASIQKRYSVTLVIGP